MILFIVILYYKNFLHTHTHTLSLSLSLSRWELQKNFMKFAIYDYEKHSLLIIIRYSMRINAIYKNVFSR